MHGVVSLLDEQSYEQVERLWAELERRFGLRGIYRTPYPHFSYHVATDYDLERLPSVLEGIAGETAVFSISTSSLGVFTGANPVLYIPVVRAGALGHLHEQVWTAVEPISSGAQVYYSPANWLPHITLAQHDVTVKNLASVVEWLNAQHLNWQVSIDNLSLIVNRDGQQELYGRYRLDKVQGT